MKILVIGDLHGKITSSLKKEISKSEFDFIIGVGDYAGIDDWKPWVDYIFKLKNRADAKSPQEFFGKEGFKRLMKKDFKAGEDVLKFLNNLGKPGVYVFGNGDDEWYNYPFSKDLLPARKSRINFLKRIKKIKEMTYKVKKHNGISFLGFGGYMDAKANESHRDREWQKRVDIRTAKAEKKMQSLLKKTGKKSIFILHYPPLGVFDIISDKKNPFHGGSTGVEFFRKAILKKKPFLVLCGHMHEYQGKKKLGSSLIVNPGEGAKGQFAIIDIDKNKGKIKNIKFLGNSKKHTR